MSYDYENRLVENVLQAGRIATYTYSGDGLKRSEKVSPDPMSSDITTLTTLVWDGSEYLGEYEELI